jgi:hypothetical protein
MSVSPTRDRGSESFSLQWGAGPHRAMERLGDEEYPLGPRRSYTSRPVPVALPRGQRSQSRILLLKIPHCGLDASKSDYPIDPNQLKATMPTTTPTILDQISAEKMKVSERWVDTVLMQRALGAGDSTPP